jgi:hypothetical protein
MALACLGSWLAGIDSVAAARTIQMQALLKEDGSGFLFVNTPESPMSWEVCSATLTNCASFGTGGEITTAGAPPESVFRVTGGMGSVGLSPIWHGNVSPLTPPSTKGAVRANELVTPVAGGWSGGWEGEPDSMQLSVCPSRAAVSCVTLTHSHYVGGCPNRSAVLDPAFVGEYLRVADRRRGAGPLIMLLYAVGSPFGLDLWRPGATISAAIVGRVAPPAGPRKASCGPPPLNSASISKEGVARVECGLGCRAVLVARQGRLKGRAARNLSRAPASPLRLGERQIPLRRPISLRPPPRFLARAGQGSIRLTVRIDGERVASRTVRRRAIDVSSS